MTPEMEHLYYVALAADDAWSKALQCNFGRNAGDARYDDRGVSTPELKELHRSFRLANEAWLDAVRTQRKQPSTDTSPAPESRASWTQHPA